MGFIRIIPWHYRLLTIIVLIGTVYAAGYVKCLSNEQDKQTVKDEKIIVQRIEKTIKILVSDNQGQIQYEKGKASRDEEVTQLIAKLSIPPNPVCDYSPDTRSLLNEYRASSIPTYSSVLTEKLRGIDTHTQ